MNRDLPLERLLDERKITPREYRAGDKLRIFHRSARLLKPLSGDQALKDAPLDPLQNLHRALDARELHYWGMAVRVCCDPEPEQPRTAAGVAILRQALQLIAEHLALRY